MKKTQDPSVVDPKTIQSFWTVPKEDIIDESIDTKSNRSTTNMLQRTKDFIAQQEEKSQDAEGIMKMCTDLYLVVETVVASVLSPKDLKQVELNFKVDKLCPADWSDILKVHFHKEYDLNSQLYTILAKSLFIEGNHSKLIIPATLIKALIKTNTYGMEARAQGGIYEQIIDELDSIKIPNIGLLKGSTNLKFEDFNTDDYRYVPLEDKYNKEDFSKEIGVEFVDNIDHLLIPVIQECLEEFREKSIYRNAYQLEDLVDVDDSGKIVYPQALVKEVLEQILLSPTETDEELDLNPIVIDIPAHCIYPIHKPGKPDEHEGYLIGLDERGNFLSNTLTQNRYKELNDIAEQQAKNQSVSSPYIYGNGMAVSYSGASGASQHRPESERENARNVQNEYAKMFEVKLMTMIAKSGKKKNIEVANVNEFYQMMFFRQLDRQKTKILYIPKDLLSYIAFNYDKNGAGEGLIEKTKLFATFRATLTFASFLAAIQMSINRTELSIGLNEDDDDQLETVEAYIHEYLSTKQTQLPTLFNKMNPSDIINDIRRAGTQVKVNGGTKFPNMEIDSNEKKSNITPPDDQLMERMRDAHYNGLLTTPDAVNGFSNADFAATIATNNLYHARRYQKIQDNYSKQLSHLVKMYILRGGPLYKKLKESFEAAKVDGISFKECVKSIELSLPRAETSVVKAQLEAYTAYSELLEKVVEDAFLSNDLLRDLLHGENLPNDIEPVKKQIIALAKRQYLSSENILPELTDLFINDDVNTSELIKGHSDKIIGLLAEISKDILKLETKEEAKIKALQEKLNPEGSENSDENFNSNENNEDGEQSESTEEGADDFGSENTVDESGSDESFNDDFSNDNLENDDMSAAGVNEEETSEETPPEETDENTTNENEEVETETEETSDNEEEEESETTPSEKRPTPRVIKEDVPEVPVEEEEEPIVEDTEEETDENNEEEEITDSDKQKDKDGDTEEESEDNTEEEELSDEEKEKLDKKKKVKDSDVEDE